MIAAHAVCNYRREKTFHRRKHGDREGGGEEGKEVYAVEVGEGDMGDAAGDAAELGADGFQVEMEGCGSGGEQDEGYDGSGDAAGKVWQTKDDGERGEAYGDGFRAGGGDVVGEEFDAGEEVAGDGGGGKSEEVFDLGGGDEEGNAVGEADGDRAGNVFDGRAEARKSHDKKEKAGHDADEREAGHAEFHDDSGDDDDEGAGGAANLGARSAEEGDEESGDNCCVKTNLRGDAGGDGEGHG